MSGKSFAEYISIAMFAGLIFAIVLGVFHTLYMNNLVKPEVMNIKKKIASIDKTIKRQLNTPDNKFNAELFDNLITKTKGTAYLSDFRKYVMNDYKQKDYAKAQQKIIMIILYSHLYDNIPDTNPRALQLVNYYFFKEPYIPSAEMEINADDTSNLSFVSLLLEKNNVGAIGDELINYDFYTGIEKDANIRKVRENVMRFFNNLNKELTAFTFQNKLHLFIWYIVIFFVITIIALFIYMRVVYKMSNGTFNKPMQELAGNITNGISSGLGIATAVVVPSAPDAPNKTEAKVDGWEPIVSPANTAPRPNYMESENTSTNDMTKEVDK
jgi:ABC-type multidrug transport system fused ATPase/permease subunit